MKKTILFFLFISGLAFGQNNFIMQKDFISNGENKVKVDKMIITYDGENKNVNTKLFIGKDKSNKQDYMFFNKMIEILLLEAKYTLKSKSTFSAQDINIYQYEEGKWFTAITYSGENSYGGKKDSHYSLIFDNDLKYVKKYQSPE